jgi:hypothetical protein
MTQTWIKWLVNNSMRFVVYFVWFLVLPLYLIAYAKDAASDASNDLKKIQKLKKD